MGIAAGEGGSKRRTERVDVDLRRKQVPLDEAIAEQLAITLRLLEELMGALVGETPIERRYWAAYRDPAWLRPLVAVGFELASFLGGRVDPWRRADAVRRLYATLTTPDGDSELAVRYRALRFARPEVLTRHLRLVSAVMRIEALCRRATRG